MNNQGRQEDIEEIDEIMKEEARKEAGEEWEEEDPWAEEDMDGRNLRQGRRKGGENERE